MVALVDLVQSNSEDLKAGLITGPGNSVNPHTPAWVTVHHLLATLVISSLSHSHAYGVRAAQVSIQEKYDTTLS